MDIDKLRQLLREPEPEDLKLDFKRKLYSIYNNDKKIRDEQWDELIKDILALANGNVGTAGQSGYLIFGVADELNEQGFRDLYDVGEINLSSAQILQKVNSICNPSLPNLYIKTFIIEGKRILAIIIPPTPHLHETTRRLKTPKTIYQENTVFIRRNEGIGLASTVERQAIQAEKQNFLYHKSSGRREAKPVYKYREIVYHEDDNATISSKRAIFKGKTYAIAHITSVSTKTIPANHNPGIIVFLLGLASTLCGLSVDESQTGCLGIGIFLLLIGLVVIVTTKSEHVVLIGSMSGNTAVLRSTGKSYINRIVTALNDAITGAEYNPDKYRTFEKTSQTQEWLTSLPLQFSDNKLLLGLILSGLVFIGIICWGIIFFSVFTNTSSSPQTSKEVASPTLPEVAVIPATSKPTLTSTSTPKPTDTPEPTPTNTSVVLPTSTATSVISPTDTPISTVSTTETPFPEEDLHLRFGEMLTVDNWEIRVERVEARDQMTFHEQLRKPAGRFALIFMTVTNLGLSPDTFVAFGTVEIQDGGGSTFDEDSVISFWAEVEYETDIGANINPDDTAFVVAAYDIPNRSDTYTLIPGRLAKQSTGSILLDIP